MTDGQKPQFRHKHIEKNYYNGAYVNRIEAEIADILAAQAQEDNDLQEAHCIALITHGKIISLVDLRKQQSPAPDMASQIAFGAWLAHQILDLFPYFFETPATIQKELDLPFISWQKKSLWRRLTEFMKGGAEK